MELVALTPGDAVIQAAKLVASQGEEVAPRGIPTREIRHVQILVRRPSLPFDIEGRSLRPFIAAAEALQLVGQVSVPELMVRGSAPFKRYQDGQVFHGAYGVRVHGRLTPLVDTMRGDEGTRQAVLTVYDSRQDLDAPVRDVPCTISLQFLARHGRLDMRTSMRSNDVWLGLPYDLHQFIALQSAVASDLDLELGEYVHAVGSLHAYDKDLEGIADLGHPIVAEGGEDLWSGRFIDEISADCRRVLFGLGGPRKPTTWERYCQDAIAEARSA